MSAQVQPFTRPKNYATGYLHGRDEGFYEGRHEGRRQGREAMLVVAAAVAVLGGIGVALILIWLTRVL